MSSQPSTEAVEHDNFVSSLLARLPEGDPRVWAQTLQHLVAASLMSCRLRHICDDGHEPIEATGVMAARVQIAKAGARTGDVVMIKAKNDLKGVTALLAAWLNGCAVCAVDPSAASEVHEQIATNSRAVVIIETDGSVSTHHASMPRMRAPRATGVDIALMIFTGGSFADHKGVMLTHSNVVSLLRAISTYLKIGPNERILCVPPLFFEYGLYQVLIALFTGCELVMATGLTNPLETLALIEEVQPTMLPIGPEFAAALADLLNMSNGTVASLRLVSNWEGHLEPSTIVAMKRAFPLAQIVATYGVTECKRALYLPPQLSDLKRGAVGGPMPGLDARVVMTADDGGMIEAEPGEIGELFLRGSSVMQGYHTQDNTVGARLVCGYYRDDVWLATGDLFERDADGHLYFRGRIKSPIQEDGYCIYPNASGQQPRHFLV